jgi:hypothetical protein
MDVDFLAEAGLLECGPARFPALPSIPALLRATVSGPRADALLADYATLRLVEARTRWLAGRGVESFDLEKPGGAALAELVEPGLAPDVLAHRLAALRARIAAAFDAVATAGTIQALAE